MTDRLLERIEILPAGSATHSVIWLHGLGADGNDFASLQPLLGLDDLPVRWIFPHAPVMPVTINGGMRMPAWYDILGLDLDRREDERGVIASHDAVAGLIARERDLGVPPGNVVVAGFSQGGAIALHLGLRYPERLAGILALSTYMVRRETLADDAHPANRETPIFQAHGSFDPMVPIGRGEAARDQLEALGHEVEWHSYAMQHQVCPEEVADISSWLRACLTGD
jgi:phospholipase/carboxylesterase